MAKKRLGYIGLGKMGKPMAINLLNAGYSLIVHNRSQGKVQELVHLGAQAARSPSQVAAESDVVFTNLPDTPDVLEVVLRKKWHY